LGGYHHVDVDLGGMIVLEMDAKPGETPRTFSGMKNRLDDWS